MFFGTNDISDDTHALSERLEKAETGYRSIRANLAELRDKRVAAEAKSGRPITLDPEQKAKLEGLEAEEEKRGAEVTELRARFKATLSKERSFGGRSDEPGAALRAWGDKAVRKLIEVKALDVTSGGATMPDAFFDPMIRSLPTRALWVRSVVPVVTVDSDKAWYLRQTVRGGSAAPVSSGGTKPTSTYSIERKEVPISVIAHVSEPIDRSLLADVDGLSNFLGTEMRLGVLLEEEDQILNGSGTPPDFQGLLDAGSGIGTRSLGTDSRSDAVFKALTTIRTELYSPDAIVMAPADWQDIRLEKDADGNYMYGEPSVAGPERMWGVEVITSTALTAGTALVGAFAQGCVFFDREQPRVDWTDGDTELFTTNTIIFRAEERGAFAITRPLAFVSITGF